jgi:peptidoglycan/LPS O-acetylase OafA/YrhL
MTTPSPTAVPYNPSLDGIRALAVTAVLLYHGGATSGGFLGVDVFFVLSGFLIASILIAELRDTGGLSLRRFWARRLRRLLPALVAVALFVAVAFTALDVAVPDSLHWDLAAMLTYTSNWWFMASGQAYGATSPTPVLHAWSLAIEEQWYLLFPLILLGLVLVLGRRLGVWLGPILLVGAGLSAVWTAWLAHSGASLDRIYFGTDTRVQGLLLGASMAAFFALPYESISGEERPRGPAHVTRDLILERVRGAAGWGALLALGILVAGTAISDEWLPRGGFLTVAVLSAIVIASVAPRPFPWSPAPLLSSRPFVAVGLISYGLYLWHFPVYMLITAERMGFSGLGLLGVRVLVTGILATVSYLLVEQPIRRGGLWAGRPVVGTRVIAVGVVSAVALGIALVRLPGSYAPDYLSELNRLTPSAGTTPVPTQATDAPRTNDGVDASSSSASTRPTASQPPLRSVLLVGDSVALSLLPAARADGTVVTNIATRFGCGTVPFVAVANGVILRPEEPLCRDWEANRVNEIAAQPADVGVLYLGPWEQYDRWVEDSEARVGTDAWTRATVDDYRRVINELRPHVKRIAVVLNHCRGAPETDLPVEMMYRSGRFAPVVNDLERIKATNDAALQAIREEAVTAQILDPGVLLCKDGFKGEVKGVSLYTDGVHFSESGADLVWGWVISSLKDQSE